MQCVICFSGVIGCRPAKKPAKKLIISCHFQSASGLGTRFDSSGVAAGLKLRAGEE